jgi:hypothetical protein
MSAEVPLQIEMFTDELVDTRTRKQKQAARRASAPQQTAMFSQREVAQFGVQARPRMPAIGRNGKPIKMVLQMEDLRTEEEIAAAVQKAAEEMTQPMFADAELEDVSPVQQLIDAGGRVFAALDQLTATQKLALLTTPGLLDQVKVLVDQLEHVVEKIKEPVGSSGSVRLSEEMAAPEPGYFGPGFHFNRSAELFPLPPAEEL